MKGTQLEANLYLFPNRPLYIRVGTTAMLLQLPLHQLLLQVEAVRVQPRCKRETRASAGWQHSTSQRLGRPDRPVHTSSTSSTSSCCRECSSSCFCECCASYPTSPPPRYGCDGQHSACANGSCNTSQRCILWITPLPCALTWGKRPLRAPMMRVSHALSSLM
mgnify:CR=1 FL=1